MSLTARHKKAGGFRKLVNSLETTPPEKQKQILDAMRKEDPDFVGEVERCIFNFEEFLNINDMIIAEIAAALKSDMRSLALALYHVEGPLADKFKKNMTGPVHAAFKEATEMLDKVLLREQIGGRFRVITKARELEAQRKFTLKKYSPHYNDDL